MSDESIPNDRIETLRVTGPLRFADAPVVSYRLSPERVEKLRQLLYRYGVFWEVGDVEEYSPWPGDPDGGELRIVRALSDLLEHLSPEGLVKAEELLLEGARDYGPPPTEERRRESAAECSEPGCTNPRSHRHEPIRVRGVEP